MRIKALALLIALVANIGAGSALAAEVIYFKDGKTMAVQSHEIDGEMVRVDIGGGSIMSFPLEQIDRVENDGNVVLGTDGQVNRAAPRSSVGRVTASLPDTRVRKVTRRASDITGKSGERENDLYSSDSNGMRVYRRFGNDENSARASVGIQGQKQMREPGASGSGGVGATYQHGGSRVIIKDDSFSEKPNLTSLSPRMTPPPKQARKLQEARERARDPKKVD